MSAQWIYETVPLGSVVRYSDAQAWLREHDCSDAFLQEVAADEALADTQTGRG